MAGLATLAVVHVAAADCSETKLHKKDAIAFHAFEMKNPATGETYLPNEEIEVAPGKKMLAGDFFQQVNDLESKLNPWGCSLRDGGVTSLAELDMCKNLLGKQTGAIDEDVKNHGAPARGRLPRLSR